MKSNRYISNDTLTPTGFQFDLVGIAKQYLNLKDYSDIALKAKGLCGCKT